MWPFEDLLLVTALSGFGDKGEFLSFFFRMRYAL